jgi:single-strand DNA-binding protein
MSFNQMTAIGNLGRDPELRYTPQRTAVCNFSIAVNEKQRDKSGEVQDVTMWFRCTAWDKTAEIAAKYLAKGDQVFVQGRLKVDEWTDRDGNNRYTLDVTVGQLTFLNNQRDGQQQQGGNYHQAPPQEQSAPAETAAADDDDTPDWAK